MAFPRSLDELGYLERGVPDMVHSWKKWMMGFGVLLLLLGSGAARAEESFPPSSVPVIQGMDVSAWQRTVDWHAVAGSDIQIVMMRASEGNSIVDAQFDANYAGAKAAGLAVGFYHFLTATTPEEAEKQADFFLRVIGDRTPDCLLAVDVGSAGSLSSELLTEITLTFMQRVESQSGWRIMLYTDAYAARARFGAALAAYPIWVANYGVREPEANGKWSSWVGFQYSDEGAVSGVSGRVDLDYFTREIYQSVIPTPAPTPAPTPVPTPSPAPCTSDELQCLLIAEDTPADVLAEQLQVSADTLRTLNILEGDIARAGQFIRYPGTQAASGSFAGLHVLQPMESLSTIARRYDTTTAAIRALNGLTGQDALLGQVLKVPAVGKHDAAVPDYLTENAIMVHAGETLQSIAARYGMAAETLAAINGLTPDSTIHRGQMLRLTPFGSGSSGRFRGGYVVQVNDTLDRIAKRFGVTEEALYQRNNIARRNLIFPGMVLIIP